MATTRPESDPLLDEALDWVVRLKTGAPTRADVEVLQQWRRQSAAHEQAFVSAARIYRHATVAVTEIGDSLAVADAAPAIRGLPKAFGRRAFLGGAIAAATAGYLVVQPPFGLWPSLVELSADYRTEKGEQRKILIADDLSLELNTQTSIALRSTSDETRVELISGETLVVATRPKSRPFVMVAGNRRITATEADFNVRCLDGVVSIACLNGAIEIEQGRGTLWLRKAEQISYSSAGIEPAVAVDTEQVAAWQAGLLVFREESLGNVIDEVNRYRPGKIIVTNSDLRRRVVNGTFQISKLGNFVPQVEQLFGAQVRTLPGGIVLLS